MLSPENIIKFFLTALGLIILLSSFYFLAKKFKENKKKFHKIASKYFFNLSIGLAGGFIFYMITILNQSKDSIEVGAVFLSAIVVMIFFFTLSLLSFWNSDSI